MRALIRGEEVIAEPFPPWVESHLTWMIGAENDSDGNPIQGDGWTLVEDYEPPAEPVRVYLDEYPATESEPVTVANMDDALEVVAQGKTAIIENEEFRLTVSPSTDDDTDPGDQ